MTRDTEQRLLAARLDVSARCGFDPKHERQRCGKRLKNRDSFYGTRIHHENVS